MPIKIGISRDTHQRLRDLQVGCWEKLIVHRVFGGLSKQDAMSIEYRAHEKLSEHRLVGEWFNCGPQIADETVRSMVEYRAESKADLTMSNADRQRRWRDKRNAEAAAHRKAS
jgi:hypothetical protein